MLSSGDFEYLRDLLERDRYGGHCGEGNLERKERYSHNDRIGRLLRALTAPAVATLVERDRQVFAEGWTPEHDDHHDRQEMALAAAAYLLRSADCDAQARMTWPTAWGASWFKADDENPRRMLEKATALGIAEMERLDRLKAVTA